MPFGPGPADIRRYVTYKKPYGRSQLAMQAIGAGSRANWQQAELAADSSWIFSLDRNERRDLVTAVKQAESLASDMLDLSIADTNLGTAADLIKCAFDEAMHGRGIALVHNLPREDLSENQFALLTWLIGLNIGVARPQNKAGDYLCPVRNVGTVYRSVTGRGYSSNAELDFHVDGADIVALTCFN